MFKYIEKDISSVLMSDEVVIYKPLKDKKSFIKGVIINFLYFLGFLILSIYYSSFKYASISILIISLFPLLTFLFLTIWSFCNFNTEIYLTNKRILVKSWKNIKEITFEEIKRIITSETHLAIEFSNNHVMSSSLIPPNLFKEKLLEIYPEFNDIKEIEFNKQIFELKIFAVGAVSAIILVPVLGYLCFYMDIFFAILRQLIHIGLKV